MMILITYDVSTSSDDGGRRLQKVARCCQKYGQRVQNSVFECIIDYTNYKRLQIELEKMIDPEKDSLRFYFFGDDWHHKVLHIGAKNTLDMDSTLII